MNKALAIALCAMTFIGCNDDSDRYQIGGFRMSDYFPFDGVRRWEFVNQNTDVTFKLIGDLQPAEEVDGVSRHTISWTRRCIGNDETCVDGSLVREVTWSSDYARGVFLHGYDEGNGQVTFDPPIQIGLADMKRGDVASTTTGGATWTSEVLEVVECPVQWTVEWDTCLHMRVSGGSGPVAGDYWVITDYNVVAFDVEGGPGRWELSKHEFSP